MKEFKLFGVQTSIDENKCVMLSWFWLSDNNRSEEFIIEKSIDNKQFSIIGKENKIHLPTRISSYLFHDKILDSKICYYRIFLKRKGWSRQTVSISNTVRIKFSKHLSLFRKTSYRIKINFLTEETITQPQII